MRVIATRERVEKTKPDFVEKVFGPTELDAMLGRSDFVVIAAPLIPSTESLMNAARFAAMKASAYLVNVGRGPQVDEPALIEALRTGRIAGAGLDVFDHEPLPSDSLLWNVEKLLITPHTAGMTEKLWHRHYELFSENLQRYLAREPLQSVVDKHKGY
ncbi:MAG: NAD(P)-dependent oxidoreductase [Candidatus Sulfotelmatobacter sp.]